MDADQAAYSVRNGGGETANGEHTDRAPCGVQAGAGGNHSPDTPPGLPR